MSDLKDEKIDRRGFIRAVSKAALPTIAVIGLAGAGKLAAHGRPGEPNQCKNACEGACKGTCKGACAGGCEDQCAKNCTLACKGRCLDVCADTCTITSK